MKRFRLSWPSARKARPTAWREVLRPGACWPGSSLPWSSIKWTFLLCFENCPRNVLHSVDRRRAGGLPIWFRCEGQIDVVVSYAPIHPVASAAIQPFAPDTSIRIEALSEAVVQVIEVKRSYPVEPIRPFIESARIFRFDLLAREVIVFADVLVHEFRLVFILRCHAHSVLQGILIPFVQFYASSELLVFFSLLRSQVGALEKFIRCVLEYAGWRFDPVQKFIACGASQFLFTWF